MDLHPEVMAALVRDRHEAVLRAAEEARLAALFTRARRRVRRGRHTR